MKTTLTLFVCMLSTLTALAQPEVLWTQIYGEMWNDEFGYCVQQTSDGGYIIVGKTFGPDVWLIKTDTLGDTLWTRTFGSGYNIGYSVQQTRDGGYIIAGSTYSLATADDDVYLIKIDASGSERWSQTFSGDLDDRGYSVQQTNDGGYIVAGYTESYGAGYSDVWLIRLAANPTGITESDLPQPITYSLLPAYPNPFNPSTLIRFQMPVAGDVQIQVYDIQGNLVTTLTDSW